MKIIVFATFLFYAVF